jgi:MFS transporter, DHA3 family, multidrug efflux protein
VFMPSADDGWIADTIGSWWGTGAARGLAVMFTLAGLVGVVVTVLALGSRAYRRLVKTVDEAVSGDGSEDDASELPSLVPQAA